MIKKLTCIECPKGCMLSVSIKKSRVIEVSGNECPEGRTYAVSEIENPLRILTSTILAEGLDLKMVPVRTDRPIPKFKMLEAMNKIKSMRIKKSVRQGEVIAENFLALNVNLIVTREACSRSDPKF